MLTITGLDTEKWPDARRLKAGVTLGWRYNRLMLLWLKENKGEDTALEIAMDAWAEVVRLHLLNPDPEAMSFRLVRNEIPWTNWEEVLVATSNRFGEQEAARMVTEAMRSLAKETFLEGLESFGLTGNDALTAASWHYFSHVGCRGMAGTLVVEDDGRRAYMVFPETEPGRCVEAPGGKIPLSCCLATGELYRANAEIFSEKTGKKFRGGHIEPVQIIRDGAPCCRLGYEEIG